MALQEETIEVDDPDRIDAVVEAMEVFAERGRGWVNIQPEVAPEAQPLDRSSFTRYFRRNSPDAALGTWLATPVDRAGQTRNLGVQHGLGERLVPMLADWNLALPADWRRVQDSPRRGLLAEIPATESPRTIVRWLLDVTLVATRPATTGLWIVSVFPGRT